MNLEDVIQQYASQRDLILEKRLGFGTDGLVFKTNQTTALKAFERDRQFENELGCYQRLQEMNCDQIGIFSIPTLLGFDDWLRVIEISVVTPPYLLDFGKCYVDVQPPEFPADVIQHEIERQMEDFGEDYSIVQMAILKLQEFGIYYVDAKPQNINTGRVDLSP